MELECGIGTALFSSKRGDFEKIIIANLTATSVHGGWGENEGVVMGMEECSNPTPSEV